MVRYERRSRVRLARTGARVPCSGVGVRRAVVGPVDCRGAPVGRAACRKSMRQRSAAWAAHACACVAGSPSRGPRNRSPARERRQADRPMTSHRWHDHQRLQPGRPPVWLATPPRATRPPSRSIGNPGAARPSASAARGPAAGRIRAAGGTGPANDAGANAQRGERERANATARASSMATSPAPPPPLPREYLARVTRASFQTRGDRRRPSGR